MRSLSSWLILMFMIMFLAFRVVVTLSTQYGRDLAGFMVIDNTIEIVLLFVSLLCFALFVKRLLLGGLIYLIGYGYYFGKYIFESIPILTSSESMDIIVVENVIIGILAILLGLFAVIDILVEKSRKKNYSDNKTDWFFKNKKYERDLDERADKNQYRTL